MSCFKVKPKETDFGKIFKHKRLTYIKPGTNWICINTPKNGELGFSVRSQVLVFKQFCSKAVTATQQSHFKHHSYHSKLKTTSNLHSLNTELMAHDSWLLIERPFYCILFSSLPLQGEKKYPELLYNRQKQQDWYYCQAFVWEYIQGCLFKSRFKGFKLPLLFLCLVEPGHPVADPRGDLILAHFSSAAQSRLADGCWLKWKSGL